MAGATESRRVIAVTEKDQVYAGQTPDGQRRKPGEIFEFPGTGDLPLARRSRKTGMIDQGWVQRLDRNDQPIEEPYLGESGESAEKPAVPQGTRKKTALSPAQRAMQVADPTEYKTANLDKSRLAAR